MPTRLHLEIFAHTDEFRKKFKAEFFTDVYICFGYLSRWTFAQANIYRTSAKCYRVMTYNSYLGADKRCSYISFRSIADMCVYLENWATGLR